MARDSKRWNCFASSMILGHGCFGIGSFEHRMLSTAMQHLSIPLKYVAVYIYMLKVRFTSLSIGRVTCGQFAACSQYTKNEGLLVCALCCAQLQCGVVQMMRILQIHPCSKSHACVNHFSMFPNVSGTIVKGDNGLSGFHGNFIIYLFVGNLVQKHMLFNPELECNEWMGFEVCIVFFLDWLLLQNQRIHKMNCLFIFTHLLISINQFDSSGSNDFCNFDG